MAGVGLTVLGILASIYLIQVSRASCPPGLFGDSCNYSCHCGPSCDLTTGVCDGDCDSGWVKGGGKCQKENVALKRRATTTSGTLGNWNPSGAVDGNIGDLNHPSSCFHANSVPSDWTVDLGRVYHLYDIIVYVRTDYFRRIANSIIYLDNNLSRICFTFPSSSNVNPTNVTCNGTARYVTIRNPGTNWNYDVLNFCEVVIYACSNGTYGVNCDSFCHCPDCDRWTGICSDDCRPGWQEERCDIECTSNVTYGINCSNNCADRKCNGDSSCDRFTGSCDTGCLAGWKENDCMKECDEHHYGINCSALCNQRHCFGSSSCNHVTGSCDQGCHAGWTGQSCDNDCDSDYYGPNCSYACDQRHCSGTSSCDRENGSCDKRCNPGWKGIDCKEACSRLYYGANCSRKCADLHCAGNSSCHHVTGSCDRGCDAGWTGQYCNEACDRDHYGPHCSSVCVNRHCEDASTCSPATGQCDGGCQTGWEGIDCTVTQTSESSSARDQTPIVAGSVTAVVVVILIIVVIGVLWRKRRNTSKQVSENVYYNDVKVKEGGSGGVAEHSVPVGEYECVEATSHDKGSTYTTIDAVDDKEQIGTVGVATMPKCTKDNEYETVTGRQYEKLNIMSRDQEGDYTGIKRSDSYENLKRRDK